MVCVCARARARVCVFVCACDKRTCSLAGPDVPGKRTSAPSLGLENPDTTQGCVGSGSRNYVCPRENNFLLVLPVAINRSSPVGGSAHT